MYVYDIKVYVCFEICVLCKLQVYIHKHEISLWIEFTYTYLIKIYVSLEIQIFRKLSLHKLAWTSLRTPLRQRKKKKNRKSKLTENSKQYFPAQNRIHNKTNRKSKYIKAVKTNPKIYANIECNDLEFFTL